MTFSAIPGQADTLTCSQPGVPTNGSNLVIKVRLVQLVIAQTVAAFHGCSANVNPRTLVIWLFEVAAILGKQEREKTNNLIMPYSTCFDMKVLTPISPAGPEALPTAYWLAAILPSPSGETGPAWCANPPLASSH